MLLTDYEKFEFTPTHRAGATYTIYSLINLDNGKRYIGRTRNVRSRIRNHLIAINGHYHKNKGIRKDSDCKFEFEILENGIEHKDRTDRERYWVLYFKTNDSRYGYNTDDPMFRCHNNRVRTRGRI